MTKARLIKIENRLAKIARQPGGKTLAEAVASAEARMETVRESSIASLEAKVSRLHGLAAKGRQQPAPPLDDLYEVSNQIFGIAATFKLAALSKAAYSLCDLVEGFREEGVVNWPAVDVHIDGLRLLCGGRTEGAEAILAGLQRVRDRLAAKAEA